MARNLSARIGVVLISGSIGCLLYTDPVNVAPTVSITVPQTILRGKSITFGANAHDDEDSIYQLTYDWGVASGVCPAGNALPTASLFPPGNQITYTVMPESDGDFCAYVRVTDRHKANGTATANFAVGDRPPNASIQRVSLLTQALLTQAAFQGDVVPLYSQLRYTAIGSTDPDGDVLTFVWELDQNVGGTLVPVTLNPCADASPDACFPVMTPGTYTLTVTADDGKGMTGQDQVSFDVAADQPPCIVDTDPPYAVMNMPLNPMLDANFAVNTVDDDGDPVPALLGQQSMASFVWSWRVGGTGDFTRKVSVDVPKFTIPAGTYPSGTELEVRVEAHDRRPVAPELTSCDRTKAVCPWPVTSCSQWVTWSVEFL